MFLSQINYDHLSVFKYQWIQSNQKQNFSVLLLSKDGLKNNSIATDCHHNSKQNSIPSYIVTLTANKLFVHSNYWSAPRLQFFSSNNAQYFFDITCIIFFETTKVSKCIHNDIEKGLKISSFLIYFLCIFILIERNYQNKAIHEKENIIM